MLRNKTAAVMLGLVSVVSFLTLLVASWLSRRDVQRELANVTIAMWRKK